MTKVKHNRWIDGLDAGSNFFNWISRFGYAFIILAVIISSLFFWINIALTIPEYFNLAILMINVIRLGVWMLVLGSALKYICYFLSKLFYNKELKEIEKEGEKIGKRK